MGQACSPDGHAPRDSLLFFALDRGAPEAVMTQQFPLLTYPGLQVNEHWLLLHTATPFAGA